MASGCYDQSWKQWLLTRLKDLICLKFEVCEIFGVEFYVNISVIAIPIMMAFSGCLSLPMVICALGIMASILFHEIGHAFAGFCVGNPADEIGLIACGGYTTFQWDLDDSGQSAAISLAGPLFNGIACLVLLMTEMVLWGGDFVGWLHQLIWSLWNGGFYEKDLPVTFIVINRILVVNAGMLVFNLLPAYPLDGGHILRWLLGYFFTHQTTISITMVVSRVCASLIEGMVIISNVFGETDWFQLAMTSLIAIWIWWGCEPED